ncbi:hypothetical protein OEZ86_007323 [Tetradesmus obliquus]|nr:hypothetical protein OEZ86_007323 [Tetradesmus obliquus]
MHDFHQGARLKVLFDDNGYMTVSPVGSGEEFHQGARLRVSLERSGFMTLSPAGSNEEAGFWAGPGFASYEYGVVLGPSTFFIV